MDVMPADDRIAALEKRVAELERKLAAGSVYQAPYPHYYPPASVSGPYLWPPGYNTTARMGG